VKNASWDSHVVIWKPRRVGAKRGTGTIESYSGSPSGGVPAELAAVAADWRRARPTGRLEPMSSFTDSSFALPGSAGIWGAMWDRLGVVGGVRYRFFSGLFRHELDRQPLLGWPFRVVRAGRIPTRRLARQLVDRRFCRLP